MDGVGKMAMVKDVRARWWFCLWAAAAIIYAMPIGKFAYDRLSDVSRKMRAQLIIEHRLWELHPEYSGSPDMRTSFATRLLTDRQLLTRVRSKYQDGADQIELDYRRDLTIAQAEIIVVALAVWGLPVGAAYAIGIMILRRRRDPPASPPSPPRPTYDASRYRPGP
jgi:hypothetical protein